MDLVQAGQLNDEQAREYLETIRWPNGPQCPHCSSLNATRLIDGKARPGTIQCNSCRQQFTVTVNTIMEDSHIPLNKWVLAFHLICSSKKGISALQLQRNLGLGSYRTAWFLAHRIRHAFKKNPTQPTLFGIVEVDETYVGGKPRRSMSTSKKAPIGRGTKKVPVIALVQRNGNVIAKPIARVTGKNLKGAIREQVQKESRIVTDEFKSYIGIGKEFDGGQGTVRHGMLEYARGADHVNTAESYFALLKRGIIGAFHHVSKRHLHRYCDEFSFRWDNRRIDDGERTIEAIKKVEGKRLMCKEPA